MVAAIIGYHWLCYSSLPEISLTHPWQPPTLLLLFARSFLYPPLSALAPVISNANNRCETGAGCDGPHG